MNQDVALKAIGAAMETLKFAQSWVRDTPQLLDNDFFFDVDRNRVSLLSNGAVVCQPLDFGSVLCLPTLLKIELPKKIKACQRCNGTGVEP